MACGRRFLISCVVLETVEIDGVIVFCAMDNGCVASMGSLHCTSYNENYDHWVLLKKYAIVIAHFAMERLYSRHFKGFHCT